MISVVVPIYNVETYLKECIESIINQTYKNLEIILVDDGSTDNCGNICEEYALKDSRIKVIHKENGGLSSARNAGIDIATGEYITFIDSDDYVSLDMIEWMYNSLKKYNAELISCILTKNADLLGKGNREKIDVCSPKKALEYILKEKNIVTSACAKLYRTDLFEGVRYPNGFIHEDFATTYKIFHKCTRIAYSEIPMYYYRYNPTSITKSKFSKNQLEYFKGAGELQEFIKEYYPSLKNAAISHSVRNSIAYMRRISAAGFNDKETIQFLTRNIRKNIFIYLFSTYKLTSKLYGLLISMSPNMALKIFRGQKI